VKPGSSAVGSGFGPARGSRGLARALRVLASLAAVGLAGVIVLPAGCAVGRPVEIEPRYVAVHNAFAAMGLAQVGPIHQGSLAEGREARFPVELPGQCVTVVAIGAAGVRDLDVALLDADDRVLAQDGTRDAQATTRICPDRGGRFTVVVKMARGAGEFLAASWTGGAAGGPAVAGGGTGPAATAGAAGTCEAPIELVPGSTTGNTRRGEAEHTAGCGNSEAKEVVYKLAIPRRQRVTIEVEPTNFDSVLYVRKDECTEKDAEVACNDDVATNGKRGASTRGSRIDEVFDPGTYWVFVDGYNNEVGSFRMNVQVAEVPSLADACKAARPIVQRTNGTVTGGFNHASGSCDLGKGPDVIHRLDVPQRARARIIVHSDEFSPVVHVRKTCLDDASEIGCSDSGGRSEEATFVGVVDRGSYAVFADSGDKSARGRFTIEADLTSEQGAGVRGDACGDALPLSVGDKVEGDTFEAKDDLSGKCSGAGAPDVVYRFELTRRSRVTAKFTSEEGDHVFVLLRTCTDRTSEVSCSPILDEVLAPGPYWLAIDGGSKGPFGRYAFQLKAKDVSVQETACRAPPTLTPGQTVTGTTAGGQDRFAASCGGREDAQASADRVYKLTLAARTHLQLLLSTPTHDGVLSIRKSCIDPPQMKTLRMAEVACNNDGPDNRHSKIDSTLEPGTYFVVVDGHQGKNEGVYTLEAKVLK
jgi:hypothetical protein